MNKIFHIGFQRCASTWLQKKVFPQLPLLYGNLDKRCMNLFYNHILKKSFLEYDNDYVVSSFNNILEKESNDRTFLFSEETMSGDLLEAEAVTPKEVLERIKNLGDVKVIIIIRNQVGLIWSLYKEYLKIGGCCTLKDFLHKERSSCLLSYLYYGTFIQHCYNLFGRKNVYVGAFEELGSNPKAFVDKLVYFIFGKSIWETNIDIMPVNIGYPIEMHGFLRWLNRLAETRRNPAKAEFYSKERYEKLLNVITEYTKATHIIPELTPKDIVDELTEYTERYREDNKFLEQFGNIKKLGYLV